MRLSVKALLIACTVLIAPLWPASARGAVLAEGANRPTLSPVRSLLASQVNDLAYPLEIGLQSGMSAPMYASGVRATAQVGGPLAGKPIKARPQCNSLDDLARISQYQDKTPRGGSDTPEAFELESPLVFLCNWLQGTAAAQFIASLVENYNEHLLSQPTTPVVADQAAWEHLRDSSWVEERYESLQSMTFRIVPISQPAAEETAGEFNADGTCANCPVCRSQRVQAATEQLEPAADRFSGTADWYRELVGLEPLATEVDFNQAGNDLADWVAASPSQCLSMLLIPAQQHRVLALVGIDCTWCDPASLPTVRELAAQPTVADQVRPAPAAAIDLDEGHFSCGTSSGSAAVNTASAGGDSQRHALRAITSAAQLFDGLARGLEAAAERLEQQASENASDAKANSKKDLTSASAQPRVSGLGLPHNPQYASLVETLLGIRIQ